MRILVFVLLFAVQAFSQKTLDKIVAIVDREVISLSDLNFTVQQIALQNRIDPNTPGLRDQVLDGMINDKLVLAQAILDSIEVSDEEVTQQLDQQINRLVYQAGSKERLEELYGMSVTKMKRDYQYRDLIRKQLLVQRIQQTRQASISASRREVEEFYHTYKDSIPKVPTEYELNHIFIEPKPDSTVLKGIRARAQAIADSIRAGGDFADFARRYSADGTASAGGDLGFARRGSFVKEFEEAVFTMNENQISDPVKTQFGYHIIQLMERRGESVRARHILFPISMSKANDDSAVALLNRIRTLALSGENFGVLARRYSEDPNTKDIGGDLGVLTADQLDPSYADFVKNAQKGDISEPRKISSGNTYGFHIVYVRNITPEHDINLESDFKRLEQLTMQIKSGDNYQKWIEELRKTIYWEKKI